MTELDDEFARALRNMPAGNRPPVDRIRHRARTLRLRRRGAGTTASVLAVAAIAAPVVATVSGSDDDLGYAGQSDSATHAACDPIEGSIDPDVAEPLAADEVPDRIRLLWSDSVGEPVVSVRAEDGYRHFDEVYPDPCKPDAAVVAEIIEVEDSVVTGTISVTTSSEGMGKVPEDSRTLDVGSVEVMVNAHDVADKDPAWADEYGDDEYLEVRWTSMDGTHWVATSRQRDLSDSEIRDLVESVVVGDGKVDFGDFTVARDAALVVQHDAPEHPYASYLVYDVAGSSLQLTVEARENPGLWSWMNPGDRYLVEGVGGSPTVLFSHPDGGALVRWQPEPGVLVGLSSNDGEYDTEELVQIAESVEEVAADDERLADVWGACPPGGEHADNLISPCGGAS